MKRSRIFAAFGLLAASYLVIFSRLKSESQPVAKFLTDEEFKSEESFVEPKTKHILFYTAFWTNKYWTLGNETVGSEHPLMKNCPVQNCIFTHNEHLLSNVTEYDAFIFHIAVSWTINGIKLKLPEPRTPNQLYIMAVQEPPHRTSLEHKELFDSNFFNLTMTYKIESDILFGYGRTLDKLTGIPLSPARNISWKQPNDDFEDDESLAVFERKTKNVLWVASNCVEFRMDLVTEIQKYIDVDIYGKCGNLTCTFDECTKLYNSTYKFYFAFENSLCPDYVTEKLFKVMEHSIIPVVLNGANMADFLPPKSYIEADSFATVKDLANYLLFLSNNPKEYVKYFWWKEHYEVIYWRMDLCQICGKVNDKKILSEGRSVRGFYSWHNYNDCRNPNIKLEKS